MRNNILTASETHELAMLIRHFGVRRVLEILRDSQRAKKTARMCKVYRLPSDIRARVAIMIHSRSYTQKDMLAYINKEVEHRGLGASMKISRSSFNRFLNERIFKTS